MMSRIRKVAWGWRNRLIERLADWGDRFLYKSHVGWWADRSWAEPYRPYLSADARPGEGLSSNRILDRRFTLIQAAKAVARLPGSTAECGVLRGVGSALICSTLRSTYSDGEFHYGFDAWEGLPEPTTEDSMKSGAHWWSRGALTVPQQAAVDLLSDFPNCVLKPGWMPATFKGLEQHQWRFVHVDVDLYEATLAAVEFFYPRMVRGGILLFDDYGFESCPGAKRAVDKFFADKADVLIGLATGQALMVRSA